MRRSRGLSRKHGGKRSPSGIVRGDAGAQTSSNCHVRVILASFIGGAAEDGGREACRSRISVAILALASRSSSQW